MEEMQVQSLGQEDPLEEEMATHYSILTWEIPWTKEFISSLTKKVGQDLATKKQQQAISYKGNSEFVSNIKP